ISRLLGEYWAKLLDTPRRQLLWLFHELVKSNTINAEHVLHHLLRRMTGGDLSPLNLWLVETVLDILSQHRHNWLDKKAVVPVVVYSYLRIIADHAARLLATDLAKLPEFERLWSEILHSPTSLSPKFTGVSQLLAQPPSPVCITSRLTHDMEQRIKWYLKFVHMGSHKRYLDWLTRKYLNTPESQSLRVDWIRFVVTQVHPSNETIASEVVQRWAFISWLILSCTSPTVVCNMKLALYYDWLMFDPAQHNLMNIEPGVLPIIIIRLWLATYGAGSACVCCPQFERKVVHSLAHIFDLAKMDKQMHGLLRHTFADLSARLPDPASAVVGGLQPTPIYDSAIIVSAASSASPAAAASLGRRRRRRPSSTSGGGHHTSPCRAPPLRRRNRRRSGAASAIRRPASVQRTCRWNRRLQLRQQLLSALAVVEGVAVRICRVQRRRNVGRRERRWRRRRDTEAQCEIMYQVVQGIIEEEDIDLDFSRRIATCLCEICHSQLEDPIFPGSRPML
uniref:Mediator of RNA polymerase II transcription subunit 23 n=1 Tax=Macrostomum lignano TaxID=282301 RepID=A0A1I8F404_9PLAT